MKIVQVVPNFSEGRRSDVIEHITRPFKETPEVLLLDVSSDASHNRTVVTAVGSPEAVSDALFCAIEAAAQRIDMRGHKGEHPRMGATDVVPFVPVSDIDMAECVLHARSLAERVGKELRIPVVLYESAATAEHRKSLGEIRSGEFEGWKTKILEPQWKPDFGPCEVHDTAGVTAIGARMPLVAYNVNLGTSDVSIARRIARKVRERSGGLTNVRALAVELDDRNIAQVSMNLVDHTKTPIYRALEAVKTEARRYGVPVLESEIVGLVPLRALTDCSSFYLQLAGFSRRQILETRIRALEAGQAAAEPADPLDFGSMLLSSFLERLGSKEPAPGGGSASAVAIAMGAALVSMVCRLTAGRPKYAEYEQQVCAALAQAIPAVTKALELARADSLAYTRVMDAFSLPKSTPEERSSRQKAIIEATIGAAQVPLEVAEMGVEIAELSRSLTGKTNKNAASDLQVAQLLAQAGTRGALDNVRINADSLKGEEGKSLRERAERIEKML